MTTFTNRIKSALVSFSNGIAYLLKEDSFYLLLENGGKIILDQSTRVKNLTTFTNRTK
jgi:hypothetical protein